MEIDELVGLAERIATAEGMNFGASSTREERNAHWARIIGIVHHGHPRWNQTPDSRWLIKRASADRPQSDDVVVFAPTMQMYDCIPGAGADGYLFEAHSAGTLGPPQIAYAPPVPAGGPVGGGGEPGGGGQQPPVTVAPCKLTDDVLQVLGSLSVALQRIEGKVDEARGAAILAQVAADEARQKADYSAGVVALIHATQARGLHGAINLGWQGTKSIHLVPPPPPEVG